MSTSKNPQDESEGPVVHKSESGLLYRADRTGITFLEAGEYTPADILKVIGEVFTKEELLKIAATLTTNRQQALRPPSKTNPRLTQKESDTELW